MKKILFIAEFAINGAIGFLGSWFTLQNINTIVAIFVGLLTGAYLSVCLYYKIKNKGK